MKRRVIAIVVAAVYAVATSVAAATPSTPEQPPAGTVTVVVLVSDGLTYLPVGRADIPPSACLP